MPGDGYWMPQYLVYNISAAEDEALSEKGRKGGLRSAEARAPEHPGGEPPIEPRVEQLVKVTAEPTVEPTRQDKTGQDKAGTKATPATRDARQGDASTDRVVPVDESANQGQHVVREADDADRFADLDLAEIARAVRRS